MLLMVEKGVRADNVILSIDMQKLIKNIRVIIKKIKNLHNLNTGTNLNNLYRWAMS